MEIVMEIVSGVMAFFWTWKIQMVAGLCVYIIASSLRKISEGLTVGFFRAILWLIKLPFRKRSSVANGVLLIVIVGIIAGIVGGLTAPAPALPQGPQGWHIGDEVIVDFKGHTNIGCKGKLSQWLPKRKAWRIDGGYGWLIMEESELTNLSEAGK